MIRNRLLILARIGLILVVPGTVLADQTPKHPLGNAERSADAQAVTAEDARPGWPIGMADMLSRPDAVRAAMIDGVRRGQAKAWEDWMTPGLNAGGSMYWWLLSDLRAALGQNDLAYMAAVQAYVWTRMDETQCLNNARALSKTYSKQVIAEHPILLQTQDRSLFHQAVLSAVDQTQAMLQKGAPGLGMMCLRADVLAAQQQANNRSGRHSKTMTIRPPSAARTQAILNQQSNALKRIKDELGYGKALKESSISDAWAAAQSAQE